MISWIGELTQSLNQTQNFVFKKKKINFLRKDTSIMIIVSHQRLPLSQN